MMRAERDPDVDAGRLFGMLTRGGSVVDADETDDPTFAAAVRWLLRQRDDSWTEQDAAAFRAWLSEDPRHHSAWQEVERCEHLAGVAFTDSAAPPAPPLTPPAPPSPRRPWPLAAAAVLLLGVGTLALAGARWLGPDEASGDPAAASEALVFATDPGQRRVIDLPDGSVVELDAASRLRWLAAAGDAPRRAVLEQGRACFRVQHDAQRPFLLAAGAAEVRVLGTVFAVDLRRDAVAVSLAEGSVRVDRSTSAADEPTDALLLVPGQRALIGDRILRGEHFPLDDFASWRQGRLSFHDRPLPSVLDELQRYHDVPLSAAAAVAHRRLTGSIDQGDLDAQLHSIADALDLRVHPQTGGGYHLAPADSTR